MRHDTGHRNLTVPKKGPRHNPRRAHANPPSCKPARKIRPSWASRHASPDAVRQPVGSWLAAAPHPVAPDRPGGKPAGRDRQPPPCKPPEPRLPAGPGRAVGTAPRGGGRLHPGGFPENPRGVTTTAPTRRPSHALPPDRDGRWGRPRGAAAGYTQGVFRKTPGV